MCRMYSTTTIKNPRKINTPLAPIFNKKMPTNKLTNNMKLSVYYKKCMQRLQRVKNVSRKINLKSYTFTLQTQPCKKIMFNINSSGLEKSNHGCIIGLRTLSRRIFPYLFYPIFFFEDIKILQNAICVCNNFILIFLFLDNNLLPNK